MLVLSSVTCSRLAKELKTEQEAEEGSSESTNSEEKSTDTTEKKVKDEEVSFCGKFWVTEAIVSRHGRNRWKGWKSRK